MNEEAARAKVIEQVNGLMTRKKTRKEAIRLLLEARAGAHSRSESTSWVYFTCYLGNVYGIDGQYEEALELIENALGDHPDNPDLLFALVSQLLSFGSSKATLKRVRGILDFLTISKLAPHQADLVDHYSKELGRVEKYHALPLESRNWWPGDLS